MLSAFTPALLMASVFTPGPCTTVPPMFYSDIVKTAEAILTGTAVKSESRVEEGGNTIRTYVTFARLAFHKGQAKETLTLRLEGGQVGEDRLVIAEMPQFKVGATYLLYVAGNGQNLSPIVGFHQGAFEVVQKDGREVLLSLQGLELIGVQNDRFVFAGRADAKPVQHAAPPVAVPVPGFVPRPADPDVLAKEAELLRRRAAAGTAIRPVDEAPAPANAKPMAQAPGASIQPPQFVAPGVPTGLESRDATPLFVPAGQDQGLRASSASLLSTVSLTEKR